MKLNPYQPPASEPQSTDEFPKAKRDYNLRIISGYIARIMTAISFFMLLGSLVMDVVNGVALFGCLTGFFLVLSAASVSR